MWEMPLWMLIVLIVAITVAMYFLLRPLKILNSMELVISHAFIIIGMILISVWLWPNRGNQEQTSMLIGGLWTLIGGICLVVTYIMRKRK
jgi:uncharacterized membrane protein HdeD (DUF308 family)